MIASGDHSDANRVVVPDTLTRSSLVPFYLDDAFSDGDDDDPAFQFSSTAVRAEIAKTFAHANELGKYGVENTEHEIHADGKHPSDGVDDSVSTLDIDGPDTLEHLPSR